MATLCKTVDELIEKLALTTAEAAEIEKSTVGQNKNPLWLELRKGRLTASNFYKIHTRMETVKSTPTSDCSSLVNSLLNPSSLIHLPQIAKGIELESAALSKLHELLCESHSNVRITQCGLHISTERPYLGASPDGLVTCDCCEPAIAEIKCPSKDIATLNYLKTNKTLKEKSNYYGQIQGLMGITKLKKTYFYIYYHDNQDESHLQVVNFDKEFCAVMFKNLEHFFRIYFVPALMDSPPTKKKKEDVIIL